MKRKFYLRGQPIEVSFKRAALQGWEYTIPLLGTFASDKRLHDARREAQRRIDENQHLWPDKQEAEAVARKLSPSRQNRGDRKEENRRTWERRKARLPTTCSHDIYIESCSHCRLKRSQELDAQCIEMLKHSQ